MAIFADVTIPNATRMTVLLLRVWLLVVQLPLIIIAGLDAKEWNFLRTSPRYIESAYVSTSLAVRYHVLLAVLVKQVILIPLILVTVFRMPRGVLRFTSALAGALVVTSLCVLVTGHMRDPIGDHPLAAPADQARGWFGFMFATSLFVPLAWFGSKLNAECC